MRVWDAPREGRRVFKDRFEDFGASIRIIKEENLLSRLKEKMALPMANILVWDDGRNSDESLIEYLIHEGFQIDLAHDNETVLKMARCNEYSLIIVDVGLPEGKNDFSPLQHIRSGVITPVFALTSGSNDGDRIAALEMGADDCLQKPFNARELVARIRAVLRRMNAKREYEILRQPPKIMRVGDLEMNTGTHMVLRCGRKVALTSVEFSILEILLRNAGKLVSREMLTSRALGRSLSANDRSVDVHISRLRKKLGYEVSGMERIKAIRGEGYLYALTCSPDVDSVT